MCLSVCLSACLSSALWKNGASDVDDVSDGRSDGSRDEAGSLVWGSVNGMGNFGANVERAIVTNGDFVERHGPVPKSLWADLLLLLYLPLLAAISLLSFVIMTV